MTVTIYHNPKCGTSRGALEILRAHGIEPVIISEDAVEPRRTPDADCPDGVPVKDVVRWKEKDTVAEARISEASSDDALLDAMAAHPILMNRPIVVTEKGAKLCRPSEAIKEILYFKIEPKI